MVSLSKTIRVVAAMAMLTTTPVVDAQTLVCGPNGCTRVAGQPVRNVARVVAAPVRRVASAPVRVVRSGLFGRRVHYESYAAPQVQSYGSTGGYSSYQAAPQSYGSTGGYAQPAATSGYGSHGGVSGAATTSAPASTATVPSAGCQCDCECPECGAKFSCPCNQTTAVVPSPRPTAGVCRVPAIRVSGYCRVPSATPDLGLAGL